MNNSFRCLLLTFSQTLLVFVFSVAVISCSSSSGGDDPAGGGSILSGTAATGAALDGVVNVYGSNGGEILDVATDAAGNYSIDVSGLTPPFCLCAVPDNGGLATQYSYADGAGIANITPLTTLTLFYANGEQDPASLITNWPALSAAVIANVPNAQALVNANFDGIFSAISTALNIDFTVYDFNTTAFVIGDIIDQILDLLSIDVTTGGLPVITVGSGTFVFDPNIDISGIDIGGSGSNTGTGGASLGSLQFTGAGATQLPVGVENYIPTGVNSSGSLARTWTNGVDTVVSIGLSPVDATQIISMFVATTTDSWTLSNGVAIPGTAYDGNTATFVGVTAVSGTAGELTLDGALSHQ